MGRRTIESSMKRHETGFNAYRVAEDVGEKMKNVEAPEFQAGRLIKHRPIRHCIPRSKFYFSSEEWFIGNDITKNGGGRRRRSMSESGSAKTEEKRVEETSAEAKSPSSILPLRFRQRFML